MRGKNRKPIASCLKLPQFTTMNVIDGQAGLILYASLIFCSLTIDNILNIIVLLILAGVSIATLTGENGILNQATRAKEDTNNATEKEKIGLAYDTAMSAKYANGEYTAVTEEQLKTELQKEDKEVQVNQNGDNLKVTFSNGNKYTIDKDGKIEGPIITMEEAKKKEKFEKKTKVEDTYGNIITVPEGFKIVEDSASDVTGGVVIEDVAYEGTEGSQFVWIPVGKVCKNEDKTQYETINLNRYTFTEDGTETPQNEEFIGYCKELKTSDYGNATAKENVYDAFTQKEDGKTKVEKVGGYYIGRYEARVEDYTDVKTSNESNEKSWTGYIGGKLVEKPEAQVFNYITQNKASELCGNMYTSTTFTSDLMNSYAWDTAIVYIQKFSGDPDYSKQNSLNTDSDGFKEKGTQELEEEKQDKRCNIWDMASNCYEWDTESSNLSEHPCTGRGGSIFRSTHFTSSRVNYVLTGNDNLRSFRPILIV